MWLPLFLLLPLALLVLIVLSPLVLVAIIILRLAGREGQLSPVVRASLGILCSVRGIGAAFDVLWSMPGLQVALWNRDEWVHVSII